MVRRRREARAKYTLSSHTRDRARETETGYQRYTARLNRALAGRVVPGDMRDEKDRFQHRGGASCSDAAADAEDEFKATEAGADGRGRKSGDWADGSRGWEALQGGAWV